MESENDVLKNNSYARNIGPRILEFFKAFYNVDYPLPKQDMAAIPDFAAGKPSTANVSFLSY